MKASHVIYHAFMAKWLKEAWLVATHLYTIHTVWDLDLGSPADDTLKVSSWIPSTVGDFRCTVFSSPCRPNLHPFFSHWSCIRDVVALAHKGLVTTSIATWMLHCMWRLTKIAAFLVNNTCTLPLTEKSKCQKNKIPTLWRMLLSRQSV